VFDEGPRAYGLLDEIEGAWRDVGPIHLIAGRDLALRTLAPSDFVAFASARLKRRFAGAGEAADARLDDRIHADGRFRVNHHWCHADAWQTTMRALTRHCPFVLMDLRGFDASRKGCLYELQHLAQTAKGKKVLLLVDEASRRDALLDFLAPSADGAPAWAVAAAGRDARLSGARLLAHWRAS
jgi:hypothetical protein